MIKWPVVALLLSFCLTGCKLVDQTNFGAIPRPPAPDQLTAALQAGSGLPLVVMRSDAAESLSAEALRQAVEMAEARKPGASYEISTVVPARGTFDQQIKAVEQGQQQASDVMVTLADLGVAPSRMHLLASTDPSLTTREIRIYVRAGGSGGNSTP